MKCTKFDDGRLAVKSPELVLLVLIYRVQIRRLTLESEQQLNQPAPCRLRPTTRAVVMPPGPLGILDSEDLALPEMV
jgi:hypothetical protein